MKKNSFDVVRAALDELCMQKGFAEGLFRTYYTAGAVARKAGVSASTARKYLDRLALSYRGYARHNISGTFGYRHFSY